MALHLSVPAQEDKPVVQAETRPRAVQGALALIPADDPLAAAHSLQEPLALLNRQAVRSDVRLKLVELYRPVILDAVQGLAALYRRQTLPLPPDAEAAVQAARLLLAELGYGYKLAILDYMGRVFSLGREKTLALLMQRAIHTLDQSLQVAYYVYASAPEGVWSELHRLYLAAVQHGIQDVAVQDRSGQTSVSQAYLQALLLALAHPQRLTPDGMDDVRDYLNRFGALANIQPFGTPENPAGVFLVRLKSDQPAVPFAKHKGEVDMRTDILLITVELARQLSAHLTALQAHDDPALLGLPDTARSQQYQDLLKYLVKQWALTPKRGFSRQPKNESINVCIGLNEIYDLLDGNAVVPLAKSQSQDAQPSLNFAEASPQTQEGVADVERWLILNESASGMALAKFPGVASRLCVGELLSLRGDRGRYWNLGIVRWANSENSGELEIGVQLLAPGARAVAVRLDKYQAFHPALMLPEVASLKQPATLITPCGIYQPARMLEIALRANEQPIRLLATRLLERTASFECFQFSRL